MYSNESDLRSPKGNILVSWQFIVMKILILLGAAVYLDKPTGSLAGHIALEKEGGFHLFSYDISKNKVFAVAIGPRGTTSDERGVWIKDDGSFKIDQLPVGEYQLKVRAPGFGNEYVEGLFVDDHQITEIPHPVTMSLVKPNISVAANVRVFTTKEQPSFWVSGTGVTQANVKVYKKDILELEQEHLGFSLTNDYRLNYSIAADTPFDNPLADEHPIATFTRALSHDSDDSTSAQFKCDKPLPPGDYVLEAEGTPINGTKVAGDFSWFTVTDLGLVIKKAPDAILVRAINLVTLKPIAGATVKAGFDLNLDKNKTAKTGADGFVRIPFTKEEQSGSGSFTLDTLGIYGANRAYGDLSYYNSETDKYQTYFYTDRPVYRLGQTVYFKGLARERTMTGYKNPGASLDISMEVKDPDGNSLSTGTLKTNKFGAFHGLVEIPADSKTGGYSINLDYADGTKAYESFEIMQYRKPEYQVDVTPITPRVIAGEKAKARVHAAYYFGGAVANARVKYSIYSSTNWRGRYALSQRPAYYDFFDDWSSYDGGGDSYGGDFLGDGYVQTDQNGEAIVEFQTKKTEVDASHPYDSSYLDKNYKVQAEVTDISRLTVVGSGSLLATAGQFALMVHTGSYVAKVGDSIPVTVSAIDYDGKPVANQNVTVKVARWPYDTSKHEYRQREYLGEMTVITDAEGKAKTTFDVKDQWPSDTFYVTAEARDRIGNFIFDSTNMWVANWRFPYVRYGDDANSEVLSVKLDKDVYKPGETAKVMITAPVEGGEGIEAIVSTEGAHIYNYKVVKMDATAKLIEIPLIDEYAPNVYVSVTIIDKHHKFYTQDKMIRVSPENNFLKIAIASDKPKYKPGEMVKYTITAKHFDGTPAANTDLSLGVVDESIYAIRAENAENIQKSFYVRRENAVTTVCSFPEEYSGGPDKVEPRLRKEFKDTAAWIPDLVTDKNGIAIASIKLPDNLTTWRATVRGIDMKTDVGETTQKVISTQDLILRLALPRFFSQGDEGLVSAVVHNYSDRAQSVNVTLSLSSQFKPTEALTQKLDVAPEKAARFSWHVSIVSSGKGVIQAKAVGQTVGDAMQAKIPVRPLGIPAFSAKSGVITEDAKTIEFPVGLSADADRSTAKYQLNLASSSIGPVLGNFSALIDYPYGCTEQTMSRLMPSVVAKQLQKKLHQPLSKDDDARFDAVYKIAMDKLRDYHHNDGGWGWWRDDTSSPYLTALVLDGMRLLKEVGYNPGDNLIEGGMKWMQKREEQLYEQLIDPKLVKDDNWYIWNVRESKTDLVRMLYTLSFNKNPIPGDQQRWLLKDRQHLTPESLTYLTLAFHNLKDEATAKLFYDRLIELANVTDQFTDWQHNNKMYKKLALAEMSDYSYRFTGVETTALALKAVLAMEPNNFARIEAIKRWILLQRGRDGWDNTKTTAEVFLALMQDELQSRAQHAPGNFSARVAFDHKLLADFVSNQDNLYASQKDVAVPIPPTRGTLSIEKSGPGRLYYNAVITYFRNLKAGDQIADKGMPQGLKMTRKFFRLVPGPVTSDGSIHFKSQQIADGQIKAGETVLMKTYVESPISLPYIMVQALLPSGAEVVAKDNRESNSDSENTPGMEGDWGNVWWNHEDVLDDRIVYFGTQLPQGKSEFHTMIRMELPGNIQVGPVTLEGMYTNSVRAYSALDVLHVND